MFPPIGYHQGQLERLRSWLLRKCSYHSAMTLTCLLQRLGTQQGQSHSHPPRSSQCGIHGRFRAVGCSWHATSLGGLKLVTLPLSLRSFLLPCKTCAPSLSPTPRWKTPSDQRWKRPLTGWSGWEEQAIKTEGEQCHVWPA